MGNEDENERTRPLLGFDVGLGLKMQPTLASSYSFGGNNNASSDYEESYASAFPSTAHPFAYGLLSGKSSVFTASQWQELERQKMIHKYMVASVPVPPQLLLSLHTTPPSLVSPSSNRGSTLDLRFSSPAVSASGSDLEPWRCKRTDGKKWRCSRDVLPDQKYCERHAHKRRSRSRKPVEATTTSSSSHHHHRQQQQQQPLLMLPSSATPHNNDHTSCIEWFIRGDSISSYSSKTNGTVSTCSQQQWPQQLFNQTPSSSPSPSSVSDNLNKNDNVSAALLYNQPNEYEEGKLEQAGFMSLLNPYSHHQTTPRHFIDAWESEGKKFGQQQQQPQPPLSPLSLSMLSAGGREGGDLTNTTTSPITWMGANSSPTPPGGPLGEALCLGNAMTTTTTTRCCTYLADGGHNNNNSSSCSNSKSSCDEDGSHGLNFMGRYD